MIRLRKEVKIGIIAIIVFAFSIWGFNFLKGKNILQPTNTFYVVFDRADGLIESGNVLMKGYKIGNITSLKYDHENTGKFITKIIIADKVKIPKDSYVKIKQINPLASTSDLEIIFGKENTYYVHGDTIPSRTANGFTDILAGLQVKVETVLIGVDSMLNSVNRILTPATEEQLRSSIENLHGSLISLNQSLSANGNLQNSFNNLESVTKNLKSNNTKISSTLDHLSNVSEALDSADLKTTLLRLDSAIVAAKGIMAKVNKGEGTLGKLVNDSSLYTRLDSTTYYLNQLMIDIEKNPKKYVHFSMFGKNK
jgi:phospholipid/cholesterol/gamma-HCH transport system substrate-binding protein